MTSKTSVTPWAKPVILFPESPIEVQTEGLNYVVFCEGEWYCNCETWDDVRWQVNHLIKMYAGDWLHSCMRINPNWHGWDKISMVSLVELKELSEQVCRSKPSR